MIPRNSSFLLNVKTIARNHGKILCISEIFTFDSLAISRIANAFYRKDTKLKIARRSTLWRLLYYPFWCVYDDEGIFLKKDARKIYVCYLVNGWWKELVDNLSFNAYHKLLISCKINLREYDVVLPEGFLNLLNLRTNVCVHTCKMYYIFSSFFGDVLINIKINCIFGILIGIVYINALY